MNEKLTTQQDTHIKFEIALHRVNGHKTWQNTLLYTVISHGYYKHFDEFGKWPSDEFRVFIRAEVTLYNYLRKQPSFIQTKLQLEKKYSML